jgi:GT2 family glycosyltransferase/glycosyltransferase involved in cell wall biosynthesis
MAIRGNVDGMLGSYVIGWALATPDHGNCAISILDGGGEVIARGRASRHRPDLASLGAGRTTLSFRIPVKNTAERRQLRVLADGEELPGSPITVGGGCFDGDATVDRGTVAGWVTERVGDFAPPLITAVNQHGMIVGEAQSVLDLSEPDSKFGPASYHLELDDGCFGRGELRLSILANGVKFAERSCNLKLEGNLEIITPECCAGWLVSPDAPQRSFSLEVFRDDVLAGAGVCDIVREDVRGVFPDCLTPAFSIKLAKPTHVVTQAVSISVRFRGSDQELFKGPYVVGGQAAAVVAAQRAAGLAYRGLAGIGPGERAVIQLALSEFLATSRLGEGFVAAQQTMLNPPAAMRPRLSIIIPVYRGVEVTRACLNSVLATRSPADQIVVINDASPDAAMADLLAGFTAAPNLFLLTNESNLGFVRTVNRGLGFSLGADVLLLNSDTVVYPGGLDEICRVAQSADDIGTVTALSNNATIFSYPHVSLRSETLEDIDWAQLAALALAENTGVTIDVPTGHGFCMLIKGELLRRIGFLDEGFGRGYGEENDLCMRAANHGYRHVVAAGALVQHRESISFVGEKASLLARNLPRLNGMYPEYTPVIMNFEDADGMRSGRWALDRARLARAREAGGRFVLVITNALDGGTAKAIRDIEEVAGYGGAAKLTLRALENGYLELLGDTPAIWATFAPDEIGELFAVVAAARPEQVLVHQLLGFPARFIEQLASFAADLPSIYYVHDFYALCPRVTMIDAIGRFCDVADTDTCARCVDMGGSHEVSKLDALTPAAHRALFAEMLKASRRVIAPSPNAAGYLMRAFPGVEVQAIPHPEPAATIAAAARAGDDEEIVLLGAIGPHKGSGKLFEIAQRARLTHPRLSFRVIGYTDIDKQLLGLGNVVITGKYKAEQLPGLIAQSRGRLALFLPSWPETYSYTLSEAAKYGFIPLVPDIGAPAERVRAAGYGVVFGFPANAAEVLEVIGQIGAGTRPAFAPGAVPAALYPTAEDIKLTLASLGLPAESRKSAASRPLARTR